MRLERFAQYNVVAVYRDMDAARTAVERLQREGFEDEAISLQSRRFTDDEPGEAAEPGVESMNTRGRDEGAARNVFRKSVGLSVVLALLGAGIGFLIGLWVFGLPSIGLWIATVVGAVTGSVIGGAQGGYFGAMQEAEKEEGILVGAHSSDEEAVSRAARTLKRLRPLRVDYYDTEGRVMRPA